MEFKDILNGFIEKLDCSGRELAQASGLSAATISRYRSGERTPEDPADRDKLIRGLAALARERGLAGLTVEDIGAAFAPLFPPAGCDTEQLRANLNALLSSLSLSVSDLARGISYDPSYLSRIRSGQRQPGDPDRFVSAVAGYVARRYDAPAQRHILAELVGGEDGEELLPRLVRWLGGPGARQVDDVSAFLRQLDEFDLNEYIRSIRFDELKIPTLPFQLPTSRTVTGLRAMMDAELDFLKTTALSRSADPVILYSDMPMTEMARDPDFPKKWMFGMAALLKKGLHLHIIHNLDRSFSEMMLGLESHIPMYMTGQISPYYLKNAQNSVFHHFLKVSGSVALSGEAIVGHHAEGRYHLTSVKSDVEYYTHRANDLLRCAKPLMDIYREDGAQRLRAFLLSDAAVPGPRRNILSSPPIYTMDEPFLRDFLARRHVSEEDRALILDYARRRRDMMDAILSHDPVEDRLPLLSPEEFAAYPLSLPLSGLFYPRDLHYTYEDYQSHLDQTRRFAETHPGYTATLSASHTFRNLEIQMHLGKWAMVSKGRSPAIHFVIHHPKLRAAIEDFVPPVVEA